jgi:regulator of nonsense transcripts 2
MPDNSDKKEDGKPVSDQSNEDLAEIRKIEIDQLNQYINERTERLKWKLELKHKNQNAESLRLDENYLKKLDSSIKKVTSFIKKIKVLTESQKDALAKEMQQLNLTKYLSEAVSALLEAKLKMNDIPCALHLCSILHQNYADFSIMMFEQWQKLLNLKKDDKVSNPSKMRVDLRFFAELITIGVLPEKEALSLLGNQLTVLTICDKEHANISIISSFCKHCGEDFADLVPTKYMNLSNKHFIIIPNNTIYSADRQKAVRSLFKEYFKSLIQHVFNDHKEIQKIERQNKKNYQVR